MGILAGASVHYFRLAPDRWERVLDRIAAAGFRAVDTCVPWRLHERAPDAFDFGEKDRALDLPRFLALAAERGMGAILRPGPQVGAELPCFGLPDRIVDDPHVRAMGPGGGPVLCPAAPDPFPAPSYASERYLEEAGAWLRAVCAALRAHLAAEGFVRMIQVDNEACLFLRDGPFDQDYRPEAVERFRKWSAARCGGEEKDPPVRVERGDGGESARLAALWVRFKRELVVSFIGRLRGVLAPAGVPSSVRVTHNVPPSGLDPPLPPALLREAVDEVTADLHATVGALEPAMRQTLLLASVEPAPFAAELGAGTPFWAPFVTELDNKATLVAALACGLRGFTVTMGRGRDRWIGGLVGEEGEGPLFPFYQRVIPLLDEIGLDRFAPLHGAAVIVPPEAREEAVGALSFHGLPASLLPRLGMRLPAFLPAAEAAAGEWLDESARMLWDAGLFPAFLDGEGAPAWTGEPARGARLFFAPTGERIGARALERLAALAGSGARVVVGPALPARGERGGALAGEAAAGFARAVEEGRVVVSAGPAGDARVKALCDRAGEALRAGLPFTVETRGKGTRAMVHRGEEGDRWLLFLLHEGEGSWRTVVRLGKGRRLERLLRVGAEGGTGELARRSWEGGAPVVIEERGFWAGLFVVT